MIRDFWNTNLNPVTMQPRETIKLFADSDVKSEFKYTQRDLNVDARYISQAIAIEILNLGAKKIKSSLVDLGIEVQISIFDRKRFYHKSDIQAIQASQSVKKQDTSLWISSKDLRQELGLNTMQLWTLAAKNKWKKKKLNGNVNHFLRSEVLN
jgi:uncharacterized Ntn-hydrolase superfamily protein